MIRRREATVAPGAVANTVYPADEEEEYWRREDTIGPEDDDLYNLDT